MGIDKKRLIAAFALGLFTQVSASEVPSSTQLQLSAECQRVDTALAHIREQKKQKQQACDDSSLSEQEREYAQQQLEKLEEIERRLEEQRLKILFVDVNSVMEAIGSGMDWTANMLDSYFTKDEDGKNQAKAWGHVVFAWEPRTGELIDGDNFPVKFKVKAKLPNLQNKVELILSDHEDDDFQTLPYESVRPEAFKLSQNSLGAAIQLLSSKGENTKVSHRIGIGDRQLYARSSWIHRTKLFNDTVTLNISPAVEYYASDGWGARVLFDTGLRLQPSESPLKALKCESPTTLVTSD